MTNSTARSASQLRGLFLACLATLAAANLGCQNGQWGNRPAVVPPPGGMLNRPDAYYTPPAGTPLSSAPLGTQSGSVSLAPDAAKSSSVTANTSAARSPTQNTYDVSSRVAADSQPIRVLDSTTRSTASTNSTPLRGMPVNDGTNVSGWRSGISPATVSSNPFGGLRGATGGAKSSPQGFSGQDGQWRSRSSYEATERR